MPGTLLKLKEYSFLGVGFNIKESDSNKSQTDRLWKDKNS